MEPVKRISRDELETQFVCAITAVIGDRKPYEVTAQDLIAIAKKVAFYLDL